MNRKIKNLIMISILVIALVVTGFTIYKANNSTGSQTGGPPEMPSGSTPPSMPGDSSSTGDRRMPGGNMPGNVTDGMPFGDTSDSNTPPSMPNSGETPPDMPDGAPSMDSSSSLSTTYYILFAVEGLIISSIIVYLILSKFNKKTCKETFEDKDKIIIALLLTIILTGGITFGASKLCTGSSSGNNQGMPNNNSSESVTANGAKVVTSDETLSDTYTTSEVDTSVILVNDGGNATITGATITKDGGDSSSTESSEFNGVNAAILVQKGSTATIKNATISTNAKGSNAVFSTGEDSKIYISYSTITTTGSSSSRGLDATYGGYIEGSNLKITTQGGSCATLATDRGEGTVKVSNSTLETNGSGSPVIYSTGDISITDTKGVANGSQMVVIEGKNSATVTNSTLSASAKGNRGDVDQAGVMIYQSMSGDASEGTGTFTSTNSSLEISSSSDYYKSAPMFFVTNTDAVINLTDTTLSFGSNVLLDAKGTTEWGKTGSNGGNVTFNATNETLIGNITIDNLSTLIFNLTNSTYEGTINSANTAKSITLTLDNNSKIKLTGDSYITTLNNSVTDNSNIDFNGYKLYVNGTSIN